MTEFDIDFKLEKEDFVAFARGFISDTLFFLGDRLDRVAVQLIELGRKIDK